MLLNDGELHILDQWPVTRDACVCDHNVQVVKTVLGLELVDNSRCARFLGRVILDCEERALGPAGEVG